MLYIMYNEHDRMQKFFFVKVTRYRWITNCLHCIRTSVLLNKHTHMPSRVVVGACPHTNHSRRHKHTHILLSNLLEFKATHPSSKRHFVKGDKYTQTESDHQSFLSFTLCFEEHICAIWDLLFLEAHIRLSCVYGRKLKI